MDAYDVTRMVYSRVQAIEPDHASKIMGYILLQDDGEQEMFRLAFSHDNVLASVVVKVKKELGLSPRNSNGHSPSSSTAQHFLGSSAARLPIHPSQNELSPPLPGVDDFSRSYINSNEDLRHSDLASLSSSRYGGRVGHSDHLYEHERVSDRFNSLDRHLFNGQGQENPFMANDYCFQESGLNSFNGKLDGEMFAESPNGKRHLINGLALQADMLASSAWRPCLYYARGFCKHGASCKFLHSYMRPDNGLLLPQNSSLFDNGSDDGVMAGSLEKLEFEIQELLRSRKAPISIASLPQLYYERYGKMLQADGYLTESQRHGKAGYSLTKLLARLKNSVALIDSAYRPHGQHAVVLAEDAFKFTAFRGEKEDFSGANPGSRQIYLTFPADSAFSEEDVSSYFRGFGPVQDVRIPYQQKRMFGFVTFVYAETVKMILGKGNPHYICGARVLVKPYKEKGKHSDRKLAERDLNRLFPGQPFDSISGPRFYSEQPGAYRRELAEQELIVEIERKRLAELHIEKQRLQQQIFSPADVSVQSTLPTSAPSFVPSSHVGLSEPLSLPISKYNGLDANVNTFEEAERIQTFVDSDRLPENSGISEFQSNMSEEKDNTETLSDDHNLPDSPFTSPHKPSMPLDAEIPANFCAVAPPGFALSSRPENLNCRICKA